MLALLFFYILRGINMNMKGYWTNYGYAGYVDLLNKYVVFSSEQDYAEWLAEFNEINTGIKFPEDADTTDLKQSDL